jgi:hypothetical protein
MAPTWFTLRAATAWSPSQVLFSSAFGLTFLAVGMIQLVGFDCPLYVKISLIGDSRIAQPPAPSIAGADMDAQFSRDAPR